MSRIQVSNQVPYLTYSTYYYILEIESHWLKDGQAR